MESKKLLQQRQNPHEFLQLVPNDDTTRSAVPGAVRLQAQRLHSSFAENVHALFPDSDLCSLLFSPHALIDQLDSYILNETGQATPILKQILHDLLTGFGFLFYETNDSLRPSGQWSYADKYLNQAELFRPPEKDFIFAMEYALGLGVEGSQTAFYTETVMRIYQNMYSGKVLPYRIRRVWCVYRLAGAILHITPSEVLQKVREGIRKYCAAHDFRTSFTSNSEEDLYRTLSHFFLREQREKRFRRVLKRSSNVLKRTYHRGTAQKRRSHLYVAIMGIETLDDLLHRIAHIFIRTLNSRTENQKILSANRFSPEQINLILTEQLQIALPDNQDYKTGSLESVAESICQNKYDITHCLSFYRNTLSSKTESRWYEQFETQTRADCFKLSDWPAPSLECGNHAAQFGRLITDFHMSLYTIIYRKKLPKPMSTEDVQTFFDFVVNENLFSIDCSDGAPLQLAPLIAYSMLLSKTHQIRSFCSKAWDLKACLSKRSLSTKRQNSDMIRVHLYIKLRNFFAEMLNADARTISRWDCLFQEMTGYNDFYMLYPGAPGSEFNKVQWRTDNVFGDFYQQIDFSLWSIGQVPPEHVKAYLWFQEQDKALGSKSREQFIKKQISCHPIWYTEYRKKRALPWYAGDHTDFLKACLDECGFSEQHWETMNEYPYDSKVHPKDRLRSKYFPQMLLEQNLQQAMLNDSEEKLQTIWHKVFSENTP